MSAITVFNYAHLRWTLAGPSLNTASQDFCGWLLPSQIYTTPAKLPELGTDTTDVRIYAYASNYVGRYSCVKLGSWYIEFRTPNFWDTGLAQPCVLIHRTTPQISAVAHTFSHINGEWNNEWLPGSKIGTAGFLMKRFRGRRVDIGAFNIEAGNSFAGIKVISASQPRLRLPTARRNSEDPARIDGAQSLAGPLTEGLLFRDVDEIDHTSQVVGELSDREDKTLDEVESWPELPLALESMSAEEDLDTEIPPPAKNMV